MVVSARSRTIPHSDNDTVGTKSTRDSRRSFDAPDRVIASATKPATGNHMRRIATTLALAMSLLGCSAEPPGEPVALVTAAPAPCFAYAWEVLLVADPIAGVLAQYAEGRLASQPEPVVWPFGYVGRQAGSEIVVYDGDGTERARTPMKAFLMSSMRDPSGAVRATCLDVLPESKPHPPEYYENFLPTSPS
jgi:hypothetical protein